MRRRSLSLSKEKHKLRKYLRQLEFVLFGFITRKYVKHDA